MKNLLIVHPSDEMYGADKVLLKSVEALSDQWAVEVWLPKDVEYPRQLLGNALRRRGVAVTYVDLPVLRRAYMNPQSIPALVKRFTNSGRLLYGTRPDAVYINTAALASFAPLAWALKIPTVLHLHEYLSGLQKLMVVPFLHFATHIICVSESIRKVLGRSLRRRATVIYNGFALPESVPLDGQERREIRFLIASRWNAWKGHSLLLDAWDRLDRDDVSLTILGGPPPSGKAVDVPSIVTGLRRPESVQVLGETDDVHSMMNDCHVVVVPSIQPDPLPTIAIEAAAAGRVVIGSDSGGLPEIIDDCRTGWLFTSGDADSLTQVINAIDAKHLQYMGINARSKYEESFNETRFKRDVSRIFTSIATASSGRLLK